MSLSRKIEHLVTVPPVGPGLGGPAHSAAEVISPGDFKRKTPTSSAQLTVGTYRSGRSFQEPYLRAALGFIGITDIEVVSVEGVAFGEHAVNQALRLAEARADAIVRRIAALVDDEVQTAA